MFLRSFLSGKQVENEYFWSKRLEQDFFSYLRWLEKKKRVNNALSTFFKKIKIGK